jgi:FlaA1/EpsC-like NDP-sugar epimerase
MKRYVPLPRISRQRSQADRQSKRGISTMSNRTVLITGAARGLGAVVARRFHDAG